MAFIVLLEVSFIEGVLGDEKIDFCVNLVTMKQLQIALAGLLLLAAAANCELKTSSSSKITVKLCVSEEKTLCIMTL